MESSRFDAVDYEHEPFLEHNTHEHLYSKELPNKHGVSQARSRRRRWMAMCASHGAVFFAALVLMAVFPSVRLNVQSSLARSSQREHRTLWSPVNHAIKFVTDTPPFEYWYDGLYSGPPNHESDAAWNKILHHHGFRLTPTEAARLNFTESVMLPEGDYASIMGVIHNLHCLRRLRQTIHFDYYYSNLTQVQRTRNMEHNHHCIESLRTSLMCNPDLTFYPLYWSANPDHPLNLRPNTQRECVNWDALFAVMQSRQYEYDDLDRKTGLNPTLSR